MSWLDRITDWPFEAETTPGFLARLIGGAALIAVPLGLAIEAVFG